MCTIVITSVLIIFTSTASPNTDFASGMMRCTFMIAPASAPNNVVGTAFIVVRPNESDPNKGSYVLVTAAHVLESIQDEVALLGCRKRKGEKFEPAPVKVSIRKNKKRLWLKHPKADVAVMYLKLSKDVDMYNITPGVFINDPEIRKYEIHPGDTLFALGYPFRMPANPAGFPILRGGVIASYPVTRSGGGDTFLFDFEVNPGNSGGPVFLIEEIPAYGGGLKIGGGYKGLIGIVIKQKTAIEKLPPSLLETRQVKHSLHVAEVIHASLIKEAIYMLPDSEEKKKEKKKD